MLDNVFENSRKMCFVKYKIDPASFFISLGLAWQKRPFFKVKQLKKNKVILDLLIVINMLLMIEKGITGGKCHAIY